MIKLGGDIEMACSICGKLFYDTSYNVKQICLQCQHDRSLTEAEIAKIQQLGENMKVYYGNDKKLEVTEQEAWEIYRYLELKLTRFKRTNFKDEMRKKAR